MMEKIKLGLVSAGKSSDPMNKSITNMSSATTAAPTITMTSSLSISAINKPNTDAHEATSTSVIPSHAYTPRYMKSIPKQIVMFIPDIDNINNKISLYEWYEEYQSLESDLDEIILPQWIQYLTSVLSVGHTYDRIHILYSLSSPSSSSSLQTLKSPNINSSPNSPKSSNQPASLEITKQSIKPNLSTHVSQSQIHEILTQTLSKCSDNNLPIVTSKEIQLNLHPSRKSNSSILSFYQQNLIPYAIHIRESNKSLKIIPPLCIVIHFPNISSNSQPATQVSFSNLESNSNQFWTEDHDIIIQTKTTRQIAQLVLSKKLDTLILSNHLPSKSVSILYFYN